MSEPATKKRKIFNFESFSAPLKIIVGKTKQEFYVKKDLVCEGSKFFRAACKEHWESGTNNLVTLDEDDPGIFAIFVKPTSDPRPLVPAITSFAQRKIAQEKKIMHIDNQLHQLFECYYLDDSIQAQSFQNYIMDRILQKGKARLDVRKAYRNKQKPLPLPSGPDELSEIYQKTTAGSCLRKFLVEYRLCDGSEINAEDIEQFIRLNCHEYVSEILAASTKYYNMRKKALSFYEQDCCHFHVHESIEVMKVCRKGSSTSD
ncbi:hypothetical protein M7I_1696 [Glarea lozoyensis 74030]|uniref:BTB domain-containing protein n=1 Tax=Glarea lozoyensis (strain ATCC 74030 / MF5533) TaxID=1104152 RepID=H0EGS6_GLAL7|nr:hypothetical protein M7I_1696 [Glarea lozoyensis 74030]